MLSRCATVVFAGLLTAVPVVAAPAGATTLPASHSAVQLITARGEVPADENGVPLEKCGPAIDGKRVETRDVHGGKHIWVCGFNRPIFKPDYWEWSEILLM